MFRSGQRLVLLVITLSALPAQTFAREFALKSGHEEAVCTQLEKSLTSAAPDSGIRDFGCLIPLAKDSPDLHAPDWILDDDRPMPAAPGLNLYTDISRYLWDRDANPARHVPPSSWPAWTGSAQQLKSAFNAYRKQREIYYSELQVVTAYANLDIDNDGELEPVYRDNHNCLFGSIAPTLVVMNSDFSGIDHAKTERVLVHPRRRTDAAYFRPLRSGEPGARVNGRQLDLAPVEELSRDTNYEAFIYRGTAFVTMYQVLLDADPSTHHILHVYLHDRQGDREICTFSADD